jgi:hypothetical protein
MIAQIYVKTHNDITSVLVSNDKGSVYFQDVIDTPEITGIHRAVSFVKHYIDFDKTEIYPDKLKGEEIMKDAYINYSKINHCIGENPNEKALTQCSNNLSAHLRWNFTRGGKNAENF